MYTSLTVTHDEVVLEDSQKLGKNFLYFGLKMGWKLKKQVICVTNSIFSVAVCILEYFAKSLNKL